MTRSAYKRKIIQDWNADGFVYLTRGNERRQIGQGRATTISITNDHRPSGISEGQALWNAATAVAHISLASLRTKV